MQKLVFYPTIFLAEETNSMAKQIVSAIDTSKNTDVILLKAKEALKASNEKLTSILNSSLSNPFTQNLSSADNYRDSTYVGGRNAIEAYTHWVFDIPKKEAAERLLEVINRHGWSMQNFNYQKQSSATNSLLKELMKPELQNDLTTLGLINWYKELAKAQESFENIFNLKAGAQNSKESVEKKEAQIPVNIDIDKLVTYLNSIIMFNSTDEAWNKIFNDIEGIIKQMTTTAKARRSGQNNKEQDNTKNT